MIEITRVGEYERMRGSLMIFDGVLTEDLLLAIICAYTDEADIEWDWFRDSDGCTFVDEFFWPTRFFPPCIVHDYWCERARRSATRKEGDIIRREGDWIFFRLNKIYGLPFLFARLSKSVCGRFVGVRCQWWFRTRWTLPKK